MAIPETTVTAAPPLRVPLAGLVPMARLTWVALSEVSMLPLASSTATFTAGVMAAPAAALEGALDEGQLGGWADHASSDPERDELHDPGGAVLAGGPGVGPRRRDGAILGEIAEAVRRAVKPVPAW